MLSAGPTPSDSVVSMAFMSFKFAHPPTHTEPTLPAPQCSVVSSVDLAMTQPPQDGAQTSRDSTLHWSKESLASIRR